jgi:hypothetical protein
MYQYEIERPWLFTEEGSLLFIKARDNARKLLDLAGAFTTMKPFVRITIDTWKMLAICDRMVEIGDVVEIVNTDERTAGQDRVFVRPR